MAPADNAVDHDVAPLFRGFQAELDRIRDQNATLSINRAQKRKRDEATEVAILEHERKAKHARLDAEVDEAVKNVRKKYEEQHIQDKNAMKQQQLDLIEQCMQKCTAMRAELMGDHDEHGSDGPASEPSSPALVSVALDPAHESEGIEFGTPVGSVADAGHAAQVKPEILGSPLVPFAIPDDDPLDAEIAEIPMLRSPNPAIRCTYDDLFATSEDSSGVVTEPKTADHCSTEDQDGLGIDDMIAPHSTFGDDFAGHVSQPESVGRAESSAVHLLKGRVGPADSKPVASNKKKCFTANRVKVRVSSAPKPGTGAASRAGSGHLPTTTPSHSAAAAPEKKTGAPGSLIKLKTTGIGPTPGVLYKAKVNGAYHAAMCLPKSVNKYKDFIELRPGTKGMYRVRIYSDDKSAFILDDEEGLHVEDMYPEINDTTEASVRCAMLFFDDVSRVKDVLEFDEEAVEVSAERLAWFSRRRIHEVDLADDNTAIRGLKVAKKLHSWWWQGRDNKTPSLDNLEHETGDDVAGDRCGSSGATAMKCRHTPVAAVRSPSFNLHDDETDNLSDDGLGIDDDDILRDVFGVDDANIPNDDEEGFSSPSTMSAGPSPERYASMRAGGMTF